MAWTIIKKQKNVLASMLSYNLVIKIPQPFLKKNRKHPGLGIASVCHRKVLKS